MTSRDSESSNPPDGEGNVHGVDTVPPPESGDAYSAMTVVREAPPAVLEAIRKRKLEEAVKRADAAHEKKAAERAVEVTVETASEKPQEQVLTGKPAAIDTSLLESEEQAPVSPPASALAPAPLPRIEGYVETKPNGADEDDEDDDDDESASSEESALSIRPRVPDVAKPEHADASILAIEPSPEGKALDMSSPFAPSPRRRTENITLAIIAIIALAAGWVLSALFSR